MEEVAIGLHKRDRALLRIAKKVSPNTRVWAGLEGYQRDYYRRDADRFVKHLEAQNMVDGSRCD